MTNDEMPITQTEFVFRRLGEGLRIGGIEGHPFLWIALLAVVVGIGIILAIWMYRKDRVSIPLGFAVLLAALRITVILILAACFLLPAVQHWERVERRSRVAILVDVSGSMFISDEIPSATRPPDRLESRMDKVVKLLTDEQVKFLHRLMEKNPIAVYRFGSRLDEEYATLRSGEPAWNAEAWFSWLKMDPKAWLLQGLSESGRQRLREHPEFAGDQPGTPEWALAWLKKDESEVFPPVTPESGFTESDRQRLRENRERLEKRLEVSRQLVQGTNVGESALAALNREAGNMLQGLVIISDGRSTHGSESILRELRDRARRENVPVFTVAVGEDRPPISIQIVDVQTPEQAPPDERFVVRAEIDGVGLAGREKPVFLDVFKPGEDPKKSRPSHTLEAKVVFAPGEPPHAQVEFAIDPTITEGAEKLPPDFFKPRGGAGGESAGAGAGDSPNDRAASSKPELLEGEWNFVVRIPRDEQEAFLEREHRSDATPVQIIKKPLRVLLFAAGAERDFQFVRQILVREKDQKRAELSVFVQNLGRDGRDVQDVEPERRLNRFPHTLLVGEAAAQLDPKEKYYNLDQYDVIIAFDPDWSELEPEQFRLLKTWIERQAGGLIIVGGPIHTYQLARAAESDKLQILAELFPVVPGDSVLPVNPNAGLRPNTRKPWHLNFPGANKDMEFLKLDDDKNHPLAGWDDFFFRKERRDSTDTEAYRGFYSVYPVQSVKKGATVVATFADPATRLPDASEHPFLVVMDYPQGKIAFLAGELWRLRAYREAFFERFWIKQARYVSSGTRTRQNKRGVLVMGKQFSAGQFVRIEAQMFGPDSQPLPDSASVVAYVYPALSDDPRQRQEVKLNPKRSSVQWGGWFQGRHLVVNPGEYRIEIPIPGSPDALRGKFLVKESNPELDLVRPDWAALHQMASEFEEILPRLDKAKAEEARRILAKKEASPAADPRPASPANDPAATSSKEKPLGDTLRLFFNLSNAELIPDLMTTQTKVQRNRGPVDDLWDDGPVLGSDNRGQPIVLPWVLLLVVGLLSAEWLMRKLLRLA
ncbi:MAG: VWA domain-containing protein [Gemmataceae bacterium]|nr:VWA domain-containing protein [Gemmataceae bacterium]